jgi:hypothetical protein
VGLKDIFKRIFKRESSDVTAMQSDVTAMQSDVTALQSAVTASRSAATTPDENTPPQIDIKSNQSNYSAVTALQSNPPDDGIRLEKESLKLGLAAGYTGRSIHDINSSLNRIETNMITRDWFNSKSQELYELISTVKSVLEIHDRRTLEKFDTVERFLERMGNIAQNAPEPIKSEIRTELKSIESELPLSPKMIEALAVVYQVGQISYKDLSAKLGYKDVSSLRSLLSHMLERTAKIEKFEKDGDKWVRVKAL